MKTKKRILLHIVSSLALVLGLTFFPFEVLDAYTNHATGQTVPDVYGLNSGEAQLLLEEQGLSVLVVDSIVSLVVAPGAVLYQEPLAGALVKPERTIYLSVSTTVLPQFTIPNLKDMNLRQAKLLLSSLNIELGKVSYTTSEFPLIVGITHKDVSMHAGDRLPLGSVLELEVGCACSSSL